MFVISHLIFFLIEKLGGASTNAPQLFRDMGFGNGFMTDLIAVLAGTLLAPVIEELVYRGIMFRSIHDGLLRRFPKQRSLLGLPAVIAIIVTAIAFILPHVPDLTINWTTVAYFITSAGFSLVYLLTGSMIAAMVSHSLQSMYAFGGLILLGRGDYQLSPIIYLIVFLCPLWVYLIGHGIKSLFSSRV